METSKKESLTLTLKANLPVAALIVAYFITRLPWIFMVPMQGAPDEFSHFWVFRFMLENMHLPDASEVAKGGPSAVYGSLPQLGYLPHVAAAKLLSLQDPSRTGRFGSLLIGLPLVFAARYIGRIVFSREKLKAEAVPWLVVFHPQLILVHAYINNDSTAITLSGVVLALLVYTLKNGPKLKITLTLGLCLAFLALTKYSAYALFPATALAFLLAFLRFKTPIGKALAHLALLGGSTALCLPWFLRNLSLYPGDALGTRTMFHTWAVTYHRDLNFHMSFWQVVKEHRWWRSILFSFWGLFGYMDIYMWRWVYWTYFSFMLLGLTGSLTLALRQWKQPAEDGLKQIWAVLAATLIANLLAMVYASSTNLGGGQGRYLFPSEIPIICIMVNGLPSLIGQGSTLGTWKKLFLPSLVIFNAACAIGCFFYLLSRYGLTAGRTY
ncbi:MAG: hypothetical protein K2Y32_02995 [Candidatus Obscuribacterales bacterium]|nr:hypothetical protein [Candidatus Obscuribacterales bacterium]